MSLHNLGYVILSILYLFIIMFNNQFYINFMLIILTIINLIIFGKIKYRLLAVILISLIPISVSFYMAGLLFVKTGNLVVTEHLIFRTASISITGVMLISAIDFDELILYFMQKLRLPVIVGYPLLSAVNAFKNLKDEYQRINNAYLMRYGKRFYSPKILFPMLMSATRYAFHNGLSMECRGLVKTKTFIHQVKSWQTKDSIIIILNVILVIAFMLVI